MVNAFCNRDPDGMEAWVQDRSCRPVDAMTPRLGSFTFEDIVVRGAKWCAAWVAGLPEDPVDRLVFRRVEGAFDDGPDEGAPAMAGGVGAFCRGGLVVSGVDGPLLTVDGTEVPAGDGPHRAR